MRLKGNGTGRVLMFVAAAALCVGGGVAAGRLPVWGLIAKAAPAHVAHSGQKATAQGITVHGWWTIKVFNGSGLVQERQFENALSIQATNGGDAALTALLTRQAVAGPWELLVDTTTVDHVLYSAADQAGDGQLAVNDVGRHTVLTGSFTARADISIASVWTFLFVCGPSVTPAACINRTGSHTFAFTNADVSPNVTVSSGQIVQVKVDISFS
jgi:hypothetical protein